MNNEWTLHWMVKTWPEDNYNLLGVLLESSEDNYTCKWLYRLALLWVEGGREWCVLRYVCGTLTDFTLCFRNKESPKLNEWLFFHINIQRVQSSQFPRCPVSSQFPRCPVSSQFSFMLTSEPPLPVSCQCFKVMWSSVILDGVCALNRLSLNEKL